MISPVPSRYKAVAKGHNTLGIKTHTVALAPVTILDIVQNQRTRLAGFLSLAVSSLSDFRIVGFDALPGVYLFHQGLHGVPSALYRRIARLP